MLWLLLAAIPEAQQHECVFDQVTDQPLEYLSAVSV